MRRSYPMIRAAAHIDGKQFTEEHLLTESPIVIRGLCADWEACRRWTPDYFRSLAPTLKIPIKTYRAENIDVSNWTLGAYADYLIDAENATEGDQTTDPPPYCHDIPIFAMVESLIGDCLPFPAQLLPDWYRKDWWKYAQFFLGPANSLTPLHFDTLLTHNLFFQIKGRKRFTLISANQADYCGRRGWRWFDVDPEKPDLRKFPEYENASPTEMIVGPGDALYLPPGTLHHVRSLDTSISFNIDFHTKGSALRALAAGVRGMPMKSLYYNLLIALGLVGGIPESMIFKFYRPYLSYVS